MPCAALRLRCTVCGFAAPLRMRGVAAPLRMRGVAALLYGTRLAVAHAAGDLANALKRKLAINDIKDLG